MFMKSSALPDDFETLSAKLLWDPVPRPHPGGASPEEDGLQGTPR